MLTPTFLVNTQIGQQIFCPVDLTGNQLDFSFRPGDIFSNSSGICSIGRFEIGQIIFPLLGGPLHVGDASGGYAQLLDGLAAQLLATFELLFEIVGKSDGHLQEIHHPSVFLALLPACLFVHRLLNQFDDGH